jgi:SRSO17 transposase
MNTTISKRTDFADVVQGHVDLVEDWLRDFWELDIRLEPRFLRSDLRRSVRAYLEALMAPVARKNGWQLAEQAGFSNPYAFQHLLGRAKWDADAVRDDLRAYVRKHLWTPDGTLVIDETGFLKKGTKSVGVARQYSGTAGRIENSQIGVFLGFVGAKGFAFVDRELYLPKVWADDEPRCEAAGVPEEVEFATKPELARQMLERALDGGLCAPFVTADEVYGKNLKLRNFLQERKQSYVLATACNQYVGVGASQTTVEALASAFSATDWQRLCCGAGSKGERLYDWAQHPINGPQGQCALLVRRSLHDVSDLAYYLCFAPVGTPLQTLVNVAGARWSIEAGFEAAKSEVGLDEYEVRSWQGWYRHITLSLLAYAFLSVVRAAQGESAPKKGAMERAGTSSLGAFKQQRGLRSR